MESSSSTRVGALRSWKGTPWISGTLLLVVGALAVYFLAGSTSPGATSVTASVSQEYGADVRTGPDEAEVVFVEYADFECSACALYAPKLADLRDKYRDDVLFVFRFFPLVNHRYGVISSQAAYAAWLQNAFWEMNDLLYENQKEWVESDDPLPFFETYAGRLGLNMEEFREDMASKDTADLITSQKEEGSAAGVNHTPFFIVNGEPIPTDDYDDLEAVIAARLR